MREIDSGYTIEPRVLSNAEFEALTDALSDASVQRSRAGARGLMSNPAVAPLAADSRLVAIARRFLGEDARTPPLSGQPCLRSPTGRTG